MLSFVYGVASSLTLSALSCGALLYPAAAPWQLEIERRETIRQCMNKVTASAPPTQATTVNAPGATDRTRTTGAGTPPVLRSAGRVIDGRRDARESERKPTPPLHCSVHSLAPACFS